MGIIALVCLMLPIVTLVEGARPQPSPMATFEVMIGTKPGDEIELTSTQTNNYYNFVTNVDGWGVPEQGWCIDPKLQLYSYSLTDMYPGTYKITQNLVGYNLQNVKTIYWTASDVPKSAYMNTIMHGVSSRCVTGGGKPHLEIYGEFWAFSIYWDYDVDGVGPLDRVCLWVETDHNYPSPSTEWEKTGDTITIHFVNRPYSLIWLKRVDRTVGKQTFSQWQWQAYLIQDISNPNTLTFDVTITKQ